MPIPKALRPKRSGAKPDRQTQKSKRPKTTTGTGCENGTSVKPCRTTRLPEAPKVAIHQNSQLYPSSPPRNLSTSTSRSSMLISTGLPCGKRGDTRLQPTHAYRSIAYIPTVRNRKCKLRLRVFLRPPRPETSPLETGKLAYQPDVRCAAVDHRGTPKPSDDIFRCVGVLV